MAPQFVVPPPHHDQHILLSYPLEHALLLTFNRPDALNVITMMMKRELERILDWFESESSLWIIIITGSGRAFSAGGDLTSWMIAQSTGTYNEASDLVNTPSGFASLSRRRSTKPILAAVNGLAIGGATELLLNCDIVIASEDAKFGIPDVKLGMVAAVGGVPRLTRLIGKQRASELLFTGRMFSAQEAMDKFHFVNEVVPRADVLHKTLEWAKIILAHSPDAIRSTKRGIEEVKYEGNIALAHARHLLSPEHQAVYAGSNIQEELLAFSKRRNPQWTNTKL